jgi:hypothetical protein
VFKLDQIKHLQFRVPVAICVGLLLAVASGILVGGASFGTLKRLSLLLLAFAYALFWQAHTWKLALAICLLGFSHIGFGFRIGVVELSSVVAAFLITITWWRKKRIARPPEMALFSFQIFNLLILTWLIYSGCHAVYNILDPFRPYDFALKNFAKTIVAMSGPPFLLFYFMHRPRGIIADEKMPTALIRIGFVALVVNILIRLWGMTHGAYSAEFSGDPEEGGYFQIPGLDLVESPFILRSLTLFTATTAAVLIGSRWFTKQSAGFRALLYSVVPLTIFGAVISGGRAAPVFTFFLGGAALWLRGHYRTVLSAAGFGIFLMIALNLIPGALNSLPPIAQRSLQMVVFTDTSEYATANISSSSSWRRELVARSFAEWRSDPRIFWFGRGTYKFGAEDLISRRRNVGEADMEISLRRGTTHSLVTDLLVIYGLCGLIIYFAMMISLLWFLWTIYKLPSMDEVGKMVTLIALLLGGFLFAYGIVGGASFPIDVTWLLIAIFGYLYGRNRSERVGIEPPRLGLNRPSFPPPPAAFHSSKRTRIGSAGGPGRVYRRWN